MQERRAEPCPEIAPCSREASASATLAQLEENLAALREPELPAERRADLLHFGAMLYHEERTFHKLVRLL